ncbi:Gamma-tubulin complex component 5 [Branchiostoma belcheri]|nr:Gamma-tubulin complex component 5 [Branchiostoma belcheri]
MFNNSSLASPVTGMTSVRQFNRQIPCILWHLQNKSSYDQAQEACSEYTDFVEFGTGLTVAFWLTGLHIIISNAAVLWGIIRTPELRKQVYMFMANLAVADMLAAAVALEFITIVLLICVMLFTNISMFIAIKERQKRRLGQPGGHNDHNALQDQPNDAAERKYQRSVHKARTVMIQVVAAFIFWLLPMILIPACIKAGEKCPFSTGDTFGVSLLGPLLTAFNSAINPVASIIRTPDLRQSLRRDITTIYRALTTMIRANRVNPQDEQIPLNQRSGTGAGSGNEQNMPTRQPATGLNLTPFNQGRAGSLAIIEID